MAKQHSFVIAFFLLAAVCCGGVHSSFLSSSNNGNLNSNNVVIRLLKQQPQPAPTPTTTANTTTAAPPVTVPPTKQCHPKNRICYYANWAYRRVSPAHFEPKGIPPNLCSHVVLAFVTVDSTVTENPSIGYTDARDPEFIVQMVRLKQQQPDLKVLLALGGSGRMNELRAAFDTAPHRSTFATNAIAFLRDNNLDGLLLEVNWPGIGWASSSAADIPLFVSFVQSLRSAFDSEVTSSPRLILAVTLSGNKNIHDVLAAADVGAVSDAADIITVAAYDYHSAYDNAIGLNAPLYPMDSWTSDEQELTVSAGVQQLIDKGANQTKIHVIIVFFAHQFNLFDASEVNLLGSSAGFGSAGKYSASTRYLTYAETCMLTKCSTTPWNYVYLMQAEAPYMFLGSEWISNQDVESIQAKVKYAMANEHGGVALWAVDVDDHSDLCATGEEFPLLKTVRATMCEEPLPKFARGNIAPWMCDAITTVT